MSRVRRSFRLLLLSLANAVVMLLLTFYWLGLPYTFGDEAFLIKWTALTKKSLLGVDKKPAPESLLFVDVSGNKTTLPQNDIFGQPSAFQRKVITDRALLAEFLEEIVPYKEHVRMVVLDVLLDQPSPADSLLQEQVNRLDDKILGINRFREDSIPPTVIRFRHQALATYRSAEDLFLKYPLVFRDSLPTVPLRLYELLHDRRLDPSGWFHRFPHGLSLPSPIVDFKVRNTDFRTGHDLGASNYAVHQLGTILEAKNFMPAEDFAEFFTGKLILIGDFENDVHDTPFGDTPGVLLILNAYLTLVGQDNIVSPFWVLLLLIGYFVICWRIFNDIEFKLPGRFGRRPSSSLTRWIAEAIDEFILLIGLTFLSFFLFNVHINILILLIYSKLIDFLWNRFRPSPSPSV